MSASRCCVIGGAGFIGRAVVNLLGQTGRKVVVANRSRPPVSLGPEVSYVQGDYGDRAFLENVLAGADEVIHLAYASVPKTSVEDPASDLLKNIPPALTLLETASRTGVNKLVLVSSGGTVYGQACVLPITETHPTNPISPYGITKLAIEKYAGLFHALKGLPVVIVRPGNAYGEEQTPFTEQGFIATAMASILQRKEICVFGATGTVRDYIHVSDVAGGILAALDTGLPGECYNLGTGVGTNNKEILDRLTTLAATLNLGVTVRHVPGRMFDVASNVLDCQKLRGDTGWTPCLSLETGLKKTWDYFVAHQ